jgi:plastocyanin
MKALAIVVLGAALAAPVATGAARAQAGNTLVATVGPGFTISLTQDGTKVKTLKAGSYMIKVHDKSVQHDFHLTGPGVGKLTSISGKPTLTWHLKLQKGKYTYVCDPHAAFMKGSFTVT